MGPLLKGKEFVSKFCPFEIKLQIRLGIVDNSKTIFLIAQNIRCDPSLEPSRRVLMMGHNMCFKGVIRKNITCITKKYHDFSIN